MAQRSKRRLGPGSVNYVWQPIQIWDQNHRVRSSMFKLFKARYFKRVCPHVTHRSRSPATQVSIVSASTFPCRLHCEVEINVKFQTRRNPMIAQVGMYIVN